MLLERTAETAAVEEATRAASAGHGALLVVIGPVGIGRTSFLHAVGDDERFAGVRVLRANGALLERDFPYGVARQLFEPVLTRAADAGRGSFDPQALITGLARDRPVLVLIDDLQWADEPSLRWLERLIPALDDLPVVVVAALRDGDPYAGGPVLSAITGAAGRTLRPRPISRAGARILVAAEFGEPGADEFAGACHGASGGNPLLLTGIVRALRAQGITPAAENAGRVGAVRPEAVRDRLVTCLRSLPEPVRTYARSRCVLGDDAAPGLVARLAGLDAADSAAAVDSLVRLGFLAAGDPHRPAHPLVAAAVEGSMTAAEGERAHLGAAALLYAGGHPAGEIAEHLLLVTVPDAPWTAEVLRSAADTAMGQGRPVPAARYLRRALLGSPAAGPQRAAVLVDLATAERGLDAVAAERHIMQAAMMLPTAGERAAAVVRVAPSTVSSYFNDLLLRVADEVGNPDTLTGADQELALLLEARCRSIRARDHFTFESAVKRLDELGAEPAVATAGQRQLLAVLLHSSMEGKMLPAAQVARLAGPIVAAQPPSPEHVHTTLPLLVPTLLAADAAGQLVPWLGTALEQVRRRQEPVPHARIAAEQALAHLALGDLSGAQAYATEACDVADEYAPGEAAEAAVVLGAVALEAGDAVLADQVLARQDARRGHPHEPGSGEGTLLLLNALVTLDRDDPRGALDHVLDCAQLLQRLGWRNTALHPWRAWAAYLYLRLGDRAAALAVAAEEVRQAREWGAPAGIGRALLVTAMVTGGEQAIEISQEAAVVLQESQNSLLRARVLVDLGQRLHATGRRAEKPLRLGYHLAVKCGAALLAGQARQSLTEAGLAGEPLTLTRTERRVAAFAAAGHTNRQIAGDLEVSLRAVEKHLTSVYRKLGASGRAQLADALRALELEASLTPGGEAGRRRDSREFRPRER